MNILNAHEIKIHVELNFSRQICGTIRNNDNDYAKDNDKDIIKKYNDDSRDTIRDQYTNRKQIDTTDRYTTYICTQIRMKLPKKLVDKHHK